MKKLLLLTVILINWLSLYSQTPQYYFRDNIGTYFNKYTLARLGIDVNIQDQITDPIIIMDIELLIGLVVITLLTIFVMVLLNKWLHDAVSTKRIKWGLFLKWFNCPFCQGFWISLILTIVFMILFKNYYYLFIPFMSSAIIWRIW